MKEKLMNDLKNAMKEKDTIKKNTIQGIRASILQYEKDNQIEANNEKIIDIISKELKKRNDTLDSLKETDRIDLIEQTKNEIKIISEYLPKQLSDGEIETIILGIIHRGIDGIGPIMKQAKIEIGNQADGKRISNIVKEILSK